MTDEHLSALGERVKAARLARKWTIEQAARRAEISRVTWSRVEDGLGVQDVKRAAVLEALELDWSGAAVGGDTQDDGVDQTGYVSAPGAKVESGITNEDLMREILRARAEYDQLRAEVRDVASGQGALRDEVRDLSGRVGRLEESGS